MASQPITPIPDERIDRAIIAVRGHKVMLDSDLEQLYGVSTSRLNQQVNRNLRRFPSDFMFELSSEDAEILRSQFATSSRGWGGRRHLPRVFTEQGVAMLSTVLNSDRAIQVNIEIMRAFVRLRYMAASHEELRKKLDDLERKYDAQFKSVFDAIRFLMDPPYEPPKPGRIGFQSTPVAKAKLKS